MKEEKLSEKPRKKETLMAEHREIQENIALILQQKGLDPEAVRLSLCADASAKGELCDCYVFLTDSEFVLLSVREKLSSARGSFPVSFPYFLRFMYRRRRGFVFYLSDCALRRFSSRIRCMSSSPPPAVFSPFSRSTASRSTSSPL